MIIDVHTHIGKLPDSLFAKTTFEENLKSLLVEMKRNKVSTSFILPWIKNSDTDPSMKTVLRLTEGIKNIKVLGTIDALHYIKRDIDGLEELLRKKRIIGVKLYPGYQYFYPNERSLNPIYKLCQTYDVPVIFHSGDTLVYYDQAKVKYSHPLLIDDVAADFPDLKIIIAHLGNPWMIDCAEVLYKNKNVYADISGLVVGRLDKRFQLDSPYGRLIKRRTQELFIYSSPRKLLYGTDWPLSDMRSYIKFTRTLGVSGKDLEYIFSKNAIRLFNLKI